MADRTKRAAKPMSHKRTKKPLHGAKADEEKLFRLSSFPSLNPSPIIEVDSAGAITYLNPAAERRFPDMEAAGSEHPMLKGLQQVMVELQSGEQESVTREVEVGNEVYEQHISYVSDGNLMRIYTLDVTERRRLGHEVESHYQELQILHEISQAILSSPDLETILERILDKALQIGPFDIGIIRLLDLAGTVLKAVVSRGYQDPRNVTEKSTASGDPTAGLILVRVMAEKEAYVVENVSECDGLRSFKREGVQSAVVVSVRAQEQVLGTIELGSRSARKFQPRQVRLLEAIGSHMGIAVQKARLHEEAQRRNQELQGLYAITKATTESLDAQAIVHSALLKTIEVLQVDAGRLYLMDEHDRVLRLRAHHGLPPEAISDYDHYTPEEGIIGRIFTECRPIVFSDAASDPSYEALARQGKGKKLGFQSSAGIAIVAKGVPVGVVHVFSRAVREFSPQDIEMLSAIGGQIGIAIENSRLFQEAVQRKVELATLLEINKGLAGLIGQEGLLPKIAEETKRLLKVEMVAFRLVEGEELVAVKGVEVLPGLKPRIKIGESLTGKIVIENTPLLVEDLQEDPRLIEAHRTIFRKYGYRSFLGVPLRVEDKVVGILSIYTKTTRSFTWAEVELLSGIADLAALAVDKSRLYREQTRRRKHAEALLEISQAIKSPEDLQEGLGLVAQKIAQACEMDRCSVYLLEEDKLIPLTSQFFDGRKEPDFLYAFKALGQLSVSEIPFLAASVEQHALQVIDNPAEDPAIPTSLAKFHIKNMLVVPLIRQSVVVGLLLLDNTFESRLVAQWQMDHAIAIAKHLELTLENVRLFQETERRAREISALNTVTAAVSASLDLDEILEKSLHAVLLFTGIEVGYIRLLEGDPPKFTLKMHKGVSPALVEKLQQRKTRPSGRVEQVLTTKRSLIMENIQTQSTEGIESESPSRSFNTVAWIPIISREQVIGIINVATLGTQTLSPDQIGLLESIGASIGVAIENARLFQEAERRRKHAEALREIGLSLTATHDPQQVLKRIAEEARQLIGALFTFVVTPDTPFYRIAAVAGEDKGYRDILKLSDDPTSAYGQGPLGRAIRSRTPVICEDVLTDPLFLPWREISSERGIRSLVAVPLVVQEKPAGALITYAPIPRAYDAETMSLLSSLAAQAAAALDSARLFEEVRRKSQQFESLVKINRDVAALLDREILLPRIAEEARKILKVDSSIFRLIEGKHLVVRSASDPEKLNLRPKLRLDESVSGRIVQENRSIAIKNVFKDTTVIEEHREVYRKAGYHSFLGVPLSVGNRVIGTLNFYSKEEREFRPEEISIITSFADQAAIAIENANIYQESRRQGEIQKLLKELSQDITSLDIDSLLKKITEKVREFFEVDVCDVRMMDNWRPVGVSGVEPEHIRGTGTNRGRSKWILENR
ncbi:MAG: GAF domain-containing protein, partial [Deltaproteobacteria bacterium]|nr:GAF domain-containing protein [Deltaproteobacteria bacterium]